MREAKSLMPSNSDTYFVEVTLADVE